MSEFNELSELERAVLNMPYVLEADRPEAPEDECVVSDLEDSRAQLFRELGKTIFSAGRNGIAGYGAAKGFEAIANHDLPQTIEHVAASTPIFATILFRDLRAKRESLSP